MTSMIHRPFNGIRVLDATHVLAGPFCTYQLALLGADVIKVESPHVPDSARGRGPDSHLNAAGLGINFLVQGSNKRSIAIDLSTAEGKALFLDLADSADVLVENYHAGAFVALGLGPDSLQSRNPRLIYCSITGFGHDGERATVNAYDNVIQAASGIMAGTRARTGELVKTGASIIDYATGYSAAFAIAAALLQRATTNRGQVIDCSMFETALTLMAPEAAAALYEGQVEPRSKEAGLGTYETTDGLLMLGAFNARQNKRMWEALGRPEFAGLETWPDLWREAEAMRVSLTQILRTKSASEWEAYFHGIGIPAERIRTLEEAVHMPHLAQRQFFHSLQPPEARSASVKVPVAPFKFAEGGAAIDRPPPRTGEHTSEILHALGFSDEAIADLRSRRIVE